MTTNILIGVGGTGAKIVESAMILVAAGLGPAELYVGLVDQDSSNGNVLRTRALIDDYRAFRDAWKGREPNERLDWDALGPNRETMPFCRTEVHKLFGDTILWCPGGEQANLKSMIGANLTDRQQHLMDLLFMSGDEEQTLPLGEGYRGRAHVGAAALISRLIDPNNELTSRMSKLMVGQGDNRQVNIFIVGSAFGGTGAAGFPTIARELNRIRTGEEFSNGDHVAIGGILMLPYFGFEPPDPSKASQVVTPAELMPKTQLALEYYGQLFAAERAFDRFYVLGWDHFFPLGYHEEGNAEQQNPPLLPELFAATAVVDFFNSDPQQAQPVPTVQFSARERVQTTWKDLPLPQMWERVGQLLRFSVYWRYLVRALIERPKPILSRGNWTHRLRGGRKAAADVRGLAYLDSLIDKILHYAAALQERADATAERDWEIGLWQLRDFLDATHEATAQERVKLVSEHGHVTELFNLVIRNDAGQPRAQDAHRIHEELEEAPVEEFAAHRGFGRVIAAAYNAVRFEPEGRASA